MRFRKKWRKRVENFLIKVSEEIRENKRKKTSIKSNWNIPK